jgi:hypothetical protein
MYQMLSPSARSSVPQRGTAMAGERQGMCSLCVLKAARCALRAFSRRTAMCERYGSCSKGACFWAADPRYRCIQRFRTVLRPGLLWQQLLARLQYRWRNFHLQPRRVCSRLARACLLCDAEHKMPCSTETALPRHPQELLWILGACNCKLSGQSGRGCRTLGRPCLVNP